MPVLVVVEKGRQQENTQYTKNLCKENLAIKGLEGRRNVI